MASMPSFTEGLGVGRDHGERGLGDAGVAQVLIPDLSAHADDLLTPGPGIRFRQVDLAAQPSDQQVVEVLLVDDVGVERRRAGAEGARYPAHRQRRVALALDDAKRGLDDGVDGNGRLAPGRRPAPGRAGVVGQRLLVPGRAPTLRGRCHGHSLGGARSQFQLTRSLFYN
jgi:hypothetical protein